jgi:hypothetical protein
MAYSALAPVAAAVFGVLQDATLLATLTGGWHNDVPQAPTYPFGWYELQERERRGFGTGSLPELELRTHVFSQRGGSLAGLAEAQEANRLTVAVLRDAGLTVTDYTQAGRVIWDETVVLADQEIHGVKVHEVVALFRIYMEEPAAGLPWVDDDWIQP